MENSQVIKVVSFNLKRDGVGKKNRWGDRKELATEVIEQTDAAIIGVQELLPRMKKDLQNILQNYSIIGCGRYSGKNSYNDEHSDIMIKNDKANVNFHTTFWLSKHPEKSGSRGLLALFPRICTMAEVYIKEFDCRVRVFNTHFDHISGFARVLGVRIILDYMSRYNAKNPMPTILMGDLNAKPNSLPIRILRNNLHHYANIHLNDVYDALGENARHNTFHNFSGKVKTGKQPIDYIFVSDEFEIIKSEFVTSQRNGQYPSDHFPVMATLKLRYA